jgi:antitoxin component of RelBE/YafQ-DinJ toxin-antitoxin module
MAENPTTIRLAPRLREAAQQFAASMGITLNAALSVLISEALRAREIHPDQAKKR